MITVSDLTVELSDFSFSELSFQISGGAYAALMGKTGCGKTTILECIAGLRPIKGGTIRIGNRDVTHLQPAVRGVGYVPQDRALFPTMTVRDNLAFPLAIRGWPQKRRVERTNEIADLLGIEHLLDRRPQGLSGGESQRVALGRALSFEPAVLLLDEPLSAIDEDTREQMYEHLRRVHQHTRATVLHITHNPAEAAALASVTLRLSDGQIERE